MIWIKKNKTLIIALLSAGLFFILGVWVSPKTKELVNDDNFIQKRKDSLNIEIKALNDKIDSLKFLNDKNYRSWINSKNNYYVLNKKYKDQLSKLDSISIQQHISILTKWLDAKSKESENKK